MGAGIDMYKCKYPNLFSPVEVAGTLFKNRIFASPTGLSVLHVKKQAYNSGNCIL